MPIVEFLHWYVGPLRKTVGDFWHMIWEYKLTSIVMLTGVTEGGKVNDNL